MHSQSQPERSIPPHGKLGLSIPEACALTGVGKDLLYAEINGGRLGSLKVGKRRLIRRETLSAWLAEREAATASA